jgi:zinc/manganese transport system permease protein
MTLPFYLSQSFAWHAVIAATLVAIICGLIGTFVIIRGMAFAVHGTSELAFTGAAAGLLVANNPVAGAFGGAVIVASVLGVLTVKTRERDTAIGVILAFGLGIGVLLLGLYHGFATEATNILFGNIFGVSNDQLFILLAVGITVLVVTLCIHRPLFFASIDPEVATAKGVPVRLLGIIFLYILALTVTAAAQVVGTLLVLSLAITPAASAARLATKPTSVVVLSILFALFASLGGVIVSLASGTLKPSVCVTTISFGLYVFARLYGKSTPRRNPPNTSVQTSSESTVSS